MAVEAVRAARQNRRGSVEGKRRKAGRSDFGEAEPPNSCRRGLAHKLHDRMTDPHRHEIVLGRLVGAGWLIDLLDPGTGRSSRGLFRHRSDLMDADHCGRTNEPFYAPRENEGTGGCALGAAGDRLTLRVRAGACARRTSLNQRAGHRDRKTLLPDELAHRRGVGERAAARGNKDRQAPAAEVGYRLGEGRASPRHDPALGRNPFGAVRLACRVRAHDADDPHRRIATRPRRPEVGETVCACEEKGRQRENGGLRRIDGERAEKQP